ncbi:class I SAM-dependent methyltransferase [candidate division TA06 bacterium]|uniref:Class I SAM-dependent methyltransferase n=1 Tax=candidate division TA06 bacterium TaxID=2250710 RepID=A0A523UPB1_UNCT6|nr:MAG: class I SAM-dependent methyltransferase [candidate division TA06 bacterium]
MSEWWRDFFDKDYVDIYGPVDAKKTAAEVEGIIKILKLRKGSKVLDLCCGYGRHSIGLMKRGFDVTGYDLSAVLLERARRDCEREKVNVNLVIGDMREIPFESEFDAVINMFTAFGYFETESEDQKVLDGVHASLRPGGKFLIDTINRERVIASFREKGWEKVGSHQFALDLRSFDPLTSRISVKTVILGGKQRIERSHSMRFYTLTELGKMIEKSRMMLKSVYGHIDGRDYWIDTPRMVVLATKK